jgi:hypothetical protein
LVARVDEVAGPQSAATIERVRETLHAAAGDPSVGALVSGGCLDKEQRLVGFGGAALSAEDQGARAGSQDADKPKARETPKPSGEQRRLRRERDAAHRELEAAERAHERALADARRAQTDLQRAEKRLRAAREREQELSVG